MYLPTCPLLYILNKATIYHFNINKYNYILFYIYKIMYNILCSITISKVILSVFNCHAVCAIYNNIMAPAS